MYSSASIRALKDGETENMATIIRDDGGDSYETRGGILVTRTRRPTPYADAISSYIDRLDERRGAVFSSNYEYPGRYTRWDTAIIDPPLGISCFGRKVWIEAYNGRGEVLLSLIADKLAGVADLTLGARTDRRLDLVVNEPDRVFTEEERSKIPTVFTVLRAITDLPLGETAPFAHAVMENLIGSIPEGLPVHATPRAHLHLYGKLPLPGRKLGHITTLADTAGQALLVADALRKRIGLPASTPTTHEPSAAEGVNTDVA